MCAKLGTRQASAPSAPRRSRDMVLDPPTAMLRSDLNNNRTRLPAVAGHFYPDHAATLTRTMRGYVESAVLPAGLLPVRGVITPHAGYICSGPVAGYSFRALASSAPGHVHSLSIGTGALGVCPRRGAFLGPRL